ncbi:MAG: hypothetical protein ABFD98_11870 [Syntrophobacteraceae bacterium]
MKSAEAAIPSTIVRISPGSIVIEPGQVARYAGGNRFRADARMEEAIGFVLGRAAGLIAPVLVYAVHPVATVEGRVMRLENGCSVTVPVHEVDSSVKYVAAVVCTLGPLLEKACKEYGLRGDSLRALFLDAAGVAAMELLGERAYGIVSGRAGSFGLSAGCRFAPGTMDIPMEQQAVLFGLVDAEGIGVRLNPGMVMQPNKSVSFFVPWTGMPEKTPNRYKCRSCGLKDCRFRL